jgi:hypothetical protein
MNNRLLGTIAMICAPALLVELLLPAPLSGSPVTMGIASSIFMAGWICSNIGMRRMRATGNSLWGKLVLNIQLVGLVLACLFGIFEATQIVDPNSIAFLVTDLCWPGSMLFMLVVGIATLVAGRLRGWRRFVPLLWGLALPLGILFSVLGVIGLESKLGAAFFFGQLAVYGILLGYIVRESEPAPTAEYAVANVVG